MFKIWAKTLVGDKIKKSIIYNGEGEFEGKRLHFYLTEICDKLDIPVPVLLKSHIKNFDQFGVVRFNVSDFCRNDKGEKQYIYKAYLPVD